MLVAQHGWLSGRSPADRVHAAIVRRHGLLRPSVITLTLNYVQCAVCSTSCQYEPVLPGRPGDSSYRSCCLEFVDNVPALSFDFFPYLDLLVVATCCEKALVLGMRPLYLPSGSDMPKDLLIRRDYAWKLALDAGSICSCSILYTCAKPIMYS